MLKYLEIKQCVLNDSWVKKVTSKIGKYLELNEIENTIDQSLQDAAKAVLRWKCIALNAYIRKVIEKLRIERKTGKTDSQAKTRKEAVAKPQPIPHLPPVL